MAVLDHPEYATRDLSRIRLIINVRRPTAAQIQEQMPQGVQCHRLRLHRDGRRGCFNEPPTPRPARDHVGPALPRHRAAHRRPDGQTAGATRRGGRDLRPRLLAVRGLPQGPGQDRRGRRRRRLVPLGRPRALDEDGRVSSSGAQGHAQGRGRERGGRRDRGAAAGPPGRLIAQVSASPTTAWWRCRSRSSSCGPAAPRRPRSSSPTARASSPLQGAAPVCASSSRWPMSATKIQKFGLRDQLLAELGRS